MFATPERPLDEAYRIQVFADTHEVTADDVLQLWAREQAVPAVEAERRVTEVHLVATHVTDGLVGVSSAYIKRNGQLRMDLWHYRAFVAHDHRMSNVAVFLATLGRDLLADRFRSGLDTRCAGFLVEVENEGLKRYLPEALWIPLEVAFIGENRRGDHVRVLYFPGALAPLP